jgi:hypothetical protein
MLFALALTANIFSISGLWDSIGEEESFSLEILIMI